VTLYRAAFDAADVVDDVVGSDGLEDYVVFDQAPRREEP